MVQVLLIRNKDKKSKAMDEENKFKEERENNHYNNMLKDSLIENLKGQLLHQQRITRELYNSIDRYEKEVHSKDKQIEILQNVVFNMSLTRFNITK